MEINMNHDQIILFSAAILIAPHVNKYVALIGGICLVIAHAARQI
jgi:hypothetical protein